MSAQAPVTRAPVAGALRVIVIEDDPADALLAQEFLLEDDADFAVTWVRTLAEGLAALTPDTACVLLDLGLPDSHGVSALHALRSAAGMRAVSAGAQDYLVKGDVTPATLARSVRYAIERLGNEERDRQLFEAELRREQNRRLARGLQPQLQVSDQRLVCSTLYQPAGGDNPLGGDFLDAVELPDGTVRLVIGDVAGHGPEEAALGVSLRVGWRSLVLAGLDLHHSARCLQRLLQAERPTPDVFATMCDVAIAADRRSMAIRSAGHPPPVLLAGSDAHLVEVPPERPIGVDGEGGPGHEVPLPERWSMLLFTDGIYEGRTPGGERLGIDGFVQRAARLLRSGPIQPSTLQDLVGAAVDDHGGPLPDDVGLLACTWNGR